MNGQDSSGASRGYAFGPFRLELSSYTLWRGNDPLAITPKAFDTLVVLIRHRDRIVTKDELMNELWPGSFVSEDSLTQSVSVLRRALGDDSSQPRYIATAARHGYRFIAPVAPLTAEGGFRPDSTGLPPPAPFEHTSESGAPLSSPRWRPLSPAIVLPAAAFGALVVLFLAVRSQTVTPGPRPERGPLRFTQDAPPGTTLISGGTLSPDGRYLAFVAQDNRSGAAQLWIRPLEAAGPRALAGTTGAARPFWAPDSQRLGFFARGRLWQVALDGREPQAITAADSTTEGGGTWGTDDVVLFAPLRSGLLSVPAGGGTPAPVTALDAATKEVAHRFPQFLPDGRHFLYYADSINRDRAGTYLAALGSSDRTRILDVPASYAPPHHLIYIRDRVLTAQPFDLARARLTGSPTALAGNALQPTATNGAVLSAVDGLLAFGVSSAAEHLEWFSRSGQSMGVVEAPTALRNPALAPDERQMLAASNIDPEQKGLWLIELERGGLTRIASDGMRPFWSPDGRSFAFTSDRAAGVADIYLRATAGRDGDEQLLVRSRENKFICDWSPDGRYLVYGSISPESKSDLWLLPLIGDRKPAPLLQSPSNEVDAQVSPDGRWLAYGSDESGAWEVYVQSFPTPGHKQLVSIGGGVEPRWRRDGRELFYLAPNRNVMSVAVKTGAVFEAARPEALFRAPVPNLNVYVNWYAPTADGQRFIVDTAAATTREQPITVLVNWGVHVGGFAAK